MMELADDNKTRPHIKRNFGNNVVLLSWCQLFKILISQIVLPLPAYNESEH